MKKLLFLLIPLFLLSCGTDKHWIEVKTKSDSEYYFSFQGQDIEKYSGLTSFSTQVKVGEKVVFTVQSTDQPVDITVYNESIGFEMANYFLQEENETREFSMYVYNPD